MKESGVHGEVEAGNDLITLTQFIVNPQDLGGRIASKLLLLKLLELHIKDGSARVLLLNTKVGVGHEEYLLFLLVYAELANRTAGKAFNLQQSPHWSIRSKFSSLLLVQ
jgi:hypothetical protein